MRIPVFSRGGQLRHEVLGVDRADAGRQVVTGAWRRAGHRLHGPSWTNATVLLPVVTSTIPGVPASSVYKGRVDQPERWPATWSASATMPANNGVDSLVPQIMNHPARLAGETLVDLDRAGAARVIESPGTPRPPTTPSTELW